MLRSGSLVLRREEDLEKVKDFRDFVPADAIPRTQTSLSYPTESELLTNASIH